MEKEYQQQQKLPYEAPQITVYDYVLEKGFALSTDSVRHEEEISHFTDASGENEEGEWF
ncbi:MAG: hypothetical protein J5792_00585 [Bacteroidales bacterium]|nr:hypothetical protein [Bacteroidales bacterium]